MILWFVLVMAWWLAGWKVAASLLLTALAVESVWLLRMARKAHAAYSGDAVAREAIQKLSQKVSTSTLTESAGILDDIQAIIEAHNRTYPHDPWAGVADVRDEIAGEQRGGVLNAH